jgi:hypothetical protein
MLLTNIRVGLKVTSLKWMGPEQEGSENMAQIPSNIIYTDKILRTGEIGISTNDTVQSLASVSEQSMHDKVPQLGNC